MAATPRALSLLPLFAPLLLTGAAPAPGVLTIAVSNTRVAKGVVHVDICAEAQFLKDNCVHVGEAPAKLGMTLVTVHGVPAGRYAAQIFLDENHNGKVDRALFGIPKEGVGFSNDAKIGFGPPSWKDAVFAFDGSEATLHIRLRYFLGGTGPDGH